MQMREWDIVAGMDDVWNPDIVYQSSIVLVLWGSCVTGFDGWKHKNRIRIQLQLKWIFVDCMKCICNGAVHKMGHL